MPIDTLLERFADSMPRLLASLPVALAIMVGTFVLNVVLGRALGLLARRTHLSEADVQPIRHVLRWVLRLIALILILSVFGFQLGGIWAMISTILGLIAIGFVAVWSMLSNTSATMLILFMRPFQIGDDVEFAGEPVRGRVMDLNFFFTTLVDHDGHLLQIPNNLFFQKVLKRRRNVPPVSLAFQLNNPQTVDVGRPPAPPNNLPADTRPAPDPLLQVPDPKTMQPPATR